MKKIVALLMAAALLLCSFTAMADTTKVVVNYDEGMDITMLLPEGYTANSSVNENGILVMLITKDADSLGVSCVVAADAEYDDAIRLNDLTEEEKAHFASHLFEDLDQEAWQITVSGHGTEAIVVDCLDDFYDMGIISSLYYGYGITMCVAYADGRTLTDADYELAMQFFTDLMFEVKDAQ